MIPKMGFRVTQVRDFLSQNGYVLTVRGYDYKTQLAIVPELDGIRIKRMKLGEVVNVHDLDGFILLSGFSDVRDWWQQIKRFCKGIMWLYRVQIDDAGISRQELDNKKIEQQRMFTEQNTWSNEGAMIGHPLDIRGIDTDPALVDLQPFRDAVHADSLQQKARATERKHERMRQRYNDNRNIGGNKTRTQHATEARQQLHHAREYDSIRINDLENRIKSVDDIDEKLKLLESLEDARENYKEVTEALGA